MNDHAPVVKDEDAEHSVPNEWRKTLEDVVEAIKGGNFDLLDEITNVRPISAEEAIRIAGNIKSYGEEIANLPQEAWETSVCQWMNGYWDIWVDLFTLNEGASDLVLFVKIYETGSSYEFEIYSIHAP